MKASVEAGGFTGSRAVIPGSKSIAHRMLIAAGLAEGVSRLKSVPESDDIAATKRVLSCCGVRFETNEDETVVYGAGSHFRYDGTTADCGESGSTLRFLIPLLVINGGEAVFQAAGRLPERPLTVYEEIFHQQGLCFERDGNKVKVQGPLKAGEYRLKGNVSSQFISGLLFALPLKENDSTIIVEEPFESSSYVDLTIDSLKRAGVYAERIGNVILVPGGQKYHPVSGMVDADDSQAVFFAALAQIRGGSVHLTNMPHVSLQADRKFISLLQRMGMNVSEAEEGYVFRKGELHGCTIDLSDCPDLGPMLFALATQAEGETVFVNAGRLRLKESDRIAAMEEELRKLGCDISSDSDTVYVRGKTEIRKGAELDGHNDHRIVMALSILVSGCDRASVIDGAEAVNKSWPGFFRDLSRMGVKVELC